MTLERVARSLLFLGVLGIIWAQGDPTQTFIGARGRYWAFQKVTRPATPAIRDTWIRNPIDAFILQSLRQKQLTPSPALDRGRLIRRVTYDLTGLPPTPAEIEAFVKDKSPQAYETVVDRLLVVPVRRALGFQMAGRGSICGHQRFRVDLERPHAWRYRDYVIQSFNRDKPYDLFIKEQIAGDEMFPGSNEALIATGYLRAGSEHLVAGNVDPEESRQEVLTEIATNVGQAFLGMTINCARCHNHKFDPILQADFYSLQAVFAGAKGKDVPIATPAEKEAWDLAQKAYKEKLTPVQTALKDLAKPFEQRIIEERKRQLDPKLLEALNIPKDKRTAEQKKLASDADAQVKPTWDEVVEVMPEAVKAERAKLREQLHQVEATAPDPLPTAYAYVNTGEAAPQSYVLRLGDPHSRLDPVEPAAPYVIKAGHQIPAAATGRRTAFANWLASVDNPLAARVMANRIWQFRMGDGMVRTPNDFGTMGDKPDSHALLDWLAAEFMARGWSVKSVDRLIVTSAVYRQSSDPDELKSRADPQNRLLWRMNRKRMEGEMIRDATLSVAGTLAPQMGGRPVRIPLEPEVYDLIFTEYERDGLWPVNPDPRVQNRRGIYLYNKRSVRLPMFSAFDQPDAITSCPVRPVSTHALQALSMFNSGFMQEVSKAFAARLEKSCGADRGCQIETAWRLALSRRPRNEEVRLSREFFKSGGVLTDFCLALFNRNEFLYVP